VATSDQEPPGGTDAEPTTPEQPADTRTAQPDASSRPAGKLRTRTGSAFYGLIAGALVLVLLLVFILENTESVKITYFGAGGHISLGVALLLAALGGALLVGLVGLTHVFQLRRRIKHPRR
jgi:lipopolysaccharide assembly protein A